MGTGTLLLVPAPLDFGLATDGPLHDALPAATLRTAAELQHWVVENAKTARAFLKRVDVCHRLAAPIQSLNIVELPRAVKGRVAPAPDLAPLLAPTKSGAHIGLLSEAGLPAVADPGALLVAQAHREGIPVRSLAGSSSLVQALAASGLNGQCFAFHGYLPQDDAIRSERIRELEAVSRRLQQTQMVIETPYRNPALLAALMRALQPGTRLAVSRALTTAAEWTRCDTVARWRATPSPLPADQPAIFSWLGA